MTKTLRIISVIAAICVVAMVVLPIVLGSSQDNHIETILGMPSVVENFKQNTTRAVNVQEDSPLVRQAQLFAKYLNPPPPPAPVFNPNVPSSSAQAAPPRPAQVAPKFDLVATSYFAMRPELSLALIDEPGKGLSWVRPSNQVGHLVIQEIKDGMIVIKDGNRSYEMHTQRPPKASLLKGESSALRTETAIRPISTAPAAATAGPDRTASATRPSSRRAARQQDTRITQTTAPAAVEPEPEGIVDSEELARWERFMENSQNLSEEEWLRRAEEMLTGGTQEERITSDEAENLDELGQQLSDPNQ
ncbi:MAG: hypothetical protein WCZ89_09480 [Phycisphaerae bacterium]